MASHISFASSGLAGPTPIVPLRTLCASSTRKSTALLNPSPSPIVTTVSTILRSLSNSRVLLTTEFMKNNLDSSWFFLTNSFSTIFFSEISLEIPLIPVTFPDESFIGESVMLISISLPFFVCLIVSIFLNVFFCFISFI